MNNRKDRLCYNIIFKFIQQIIHLVHRTCRRIFNRKNCKIRRAFFNCLHRIPECPYMKAIHILPEELVHCSLPVSPLCSLKYNSCIFFIQGMNLNKR